MSLNKGIIVQVMGPVVDVKFESSLLPKINDALKVKIDAKNNNVYAGIYKYENGKPIKFYVSTDGYYQNIDDNYPFMSFDDMVQELGIKTK